MGHGKTTFVNMLREVSDNVGVIHVDDCLADAKRKYFRIFLQPSQNNTTESTKKNPKLKSGVKKIFFKNKILFGLLMKIRSCLVKDKIEQEIKKLKIEGKNVIAIDDWALTTHKELYSKLNKVYFLEKTYSIRREHLRKRDASTNEELKVADIPYALGFLKKPTSENIVTIKNNGSLDELCEKAKEEYIKLDELTFDERNRIQGNSLGDINKIMKTIQKTKQVRERIKENN